jgi:ligand-binding sensor domain-containing protein
MMYFLRRTDFLRIAVILIAAVMQYAVVKAQDPFYFHYGPINGLPSSNIYDIVQDMTGRIWLATENGVTCYDGYEFTNLPVPKGLPDNSFIKLYQGAEDRIWFISFGGYLASWSRGTFTAFPLNDSLQKWGHRYFMNALYIDSCDRIYCKSKEAGKVICIDKNLQYRITDSASFPSRIYTPFYSEFDRNKRRIPVAMVSMNQVIASDGTQWTRNENGGLVIRNAGNRQGLEVFRNSRVTRVYRDRENHYWIATEGNGLIYLPSVRMNLSNPPGWSENRNIIDFYIHRDKMYYSTADGKLFIASVIEGHLVRPRELLRQEPQKFIRSILVSRNGNLWLTQSKYLRYGTDGTKRPLPAIVLVKYYEIHESSDGSVFLATREGFVKYLHGRLEYDSRKDNFYEHTFSVVTIDDNTLYLGTIGGLFSYDGREYTNLGLTDRRFRERVKVVRRRGSDLVVGTASAGVMILETGGKVQALTIADGLPSLRVEDVFPDHDSALWIGTDRGLTRAAKKVSGGWETRNYTLWDGLPSNEVHRITRQGKYIWVATSNGIASFDPDDIKPLSVTPTMFIDHLMVNDKDTIHPGPGVLAFKPEQRTLSIFYRGIRFTDHDRLNYLYRLENYDTAWIPTRNLSVRYASLPAGNYRFLVTPVASLPGSTNPVASLNFSIKPFFYETWYFYLLTGLIALALVAALVAMIIRVTERRSRFRSDFLWNQQKALRLQMNPHFIFNALNSVQHFILTRDEEAAGLYLSNFSKLMRRVLDNSRHNLIALEEELLTLDLYLKLEKVRFEDKFDYVIDVDPLLDCTEVKIPPMLIQPFLENAIRHGLANSLQKGLLKLQFEQSGKMMKVTVEDNGIGITASREINARRQGHQSSGMKNIEERIGMLNQLLDRTINLKVTEMQEISPDQTGTRIELIIPLFATGKESYWSNFRKLWRKK